MNAFDPNYVSPYVSELHDVGNTYRFVEGVGGSPVHRDSEPQAVWQTWISTLPTFSINGFEASVRRRKKWRRVRVARSDVQRG